MDVLIALIGLSVEPTWRTWSGVFRAQTGRVWLGFAGTDVHRPALPRFEKGVESWHGGNEGGEEYIGDDPLYSEHEDGLSLITNSVHSRKTTQVPD